MKKKENSFSLLCVIAIFINSIKAKSIGKKFGEKGMLPSVIYFHSFNSTYVSAFFTATIRINTHKYIFIYLCECIAVHTLAQKCFSFGTFRRKASL